MKKNTLPWYQQRLILLVAAGVATAALAGFSLWARHFLWFEASGGGEEVWVPLLWVACLLVAALPEGALLAALILHPPTRPERKVDEDGVADDPFSAKQIFQPRALLISIFFIACIGLNFGIAWYVSMTPMADLAIDESVQPPDLGGKPALSALTDYREVLLVGRARSKDPEVLERFYKEASRLARATEMELLAPHVVRLTRSEDLATAEGACGVLAALGDRMNQNARLLAGKAAANRWEPTVLRWLREDVSRHLRELAEARPELAPSAVLALAWIGNLSDGDAFRAMVQDSSRGAALRIAAATGLRNLTRGKEDLPTLARLVHRKTRPRGLDPELEKHLFWALEAHGKRSNPDSFDPLPDEVLDETVKAISSRLVADESPAVRCMAVVVLQAFQDGRIDRDITAFMESEASQADCPRVEFRRPYGPPIPFVIPDDLQFITLNLLASIAGDNYYLYNWIQLQLADHQDRYSPTLLKGMKKVLRQIEESRR